MYRQCSWLADQYTCRGFTIRGLSTAFRSHTQGSSGTSGNLMRDTCPHNLATSKRFLKNQVNVENSTLIR